MERAFQSVTAVSIQDLLAVSSGALFAPALESTDYIQG